MIYYTVKTLR